MKTSRTTTFMRQCRAISLAGFALTLGGCDEQAPSDIEEAGDSQIAAAEAFAELGQDDEHEVPDLGDVSSMPEGSVIYAVAAETEKEAVEDMAKVLNINEISGEFWVEKQEDGIFELTLVRVDPPKGEAGERLSVPEGEEGLSPRATYYHDAYSAERTGSYGTSVYAQSVQGLGWALVSGKTSRLWAKAKWNSSVDFVHFVVTETWHGVGISGSVPWGLSGSFNSTHGTYQIAAASASGNSAKVQWCVTGPSGAAFTKKKLTAALAVKHYGKTLLISDTSSSWFNHDWKSSYDAC